MDANSGSSVVIETAPKTQRSRKSKSKKKNVPPRKQFDIPYFAHQSLDPTRYPNGLANPLQMVPTDDGVEIDGGKPEVVPDDSERDVENDDPEDTQGLSSPKTGVNSNKRQASTSNEKDEAHKRVKLTGGRPAVSKKVTADWDSDDEIIFSMKNAKFQEKDIARRLAEEGRTVYNPKSIGTRWARLKKVQQAKQDELLDADLTDWHEGDDDVLYAGFDKAEDYIQKKIKEIENRRWRIVADHVKTVKPVTNFSQNACRDRYNALQAGTAKPTPDSIPDPSPAVFSRVQSRRVRQTKIDEDRAVVEKGALEKENLPGNAWTSKQKDKYSLY